jgi:preprotein translocase SecE subunit
MAVDVARSGERPAGGTVVQRTVAWVQAIPAGYRAVMAEMKKVTWPDRNSIRQMSIGVIALSLFIGGVIAVMDFTLQQVLVRWIPQIFVGR